MTQETLACDAFWEFVDGVISHTEISICALADTKLLIDILAPCGAFISNVEC